MLRSARPLTLPSPLRGEGCNGVAYRTKNKKLASFLERPLGDGYLEGRVTKHRRGYAVDSG